MSGTGTQLHWAGVLGWRLERHYLSRPAHSALDVVDRLIAVSSWSGDSELSVGLRCARPHEGALAGELAEGRLIKTFAFGGATYLMTPGQAADHLALRAVTRQWELPSWQRHYRLSPAEWLDLRSIVRDALLPGPLTRHDLSAAVASHARFAHLAPAFIDKSFTFLKPFAWQGDLSVGPLQDGQVTLRSLPGAAGWPGIPDIEQAGPRAITSYLSAYGPATPGQLRSWFTEGLSVPRKRIDAWLAGLTDEVQAIEVAGETAYALGDFVDEIRAAEEDERVRLLPGNDQWMFGPGTTFTPIVPPERRAAVSRGANVITRGGRIVGTWRIHRSTLRADVFAEAGGLTTPELEQAARRIAEVRGAPLDLAAESTPV